MKYVSEVVPTPWAITNEVLKNYQIDLLVHGDENKNMVGQEKLVVFPRTQGISASLLRARVLRKIAEINNTAESDGAASVELMKGVIATIQKQFKLD